MKGFIKKHKPSVLLFQLQCRLTRGVFFDTSPVTLRPVTVSIITWEQANCNQWQSMMFKTELIRCTSSYT